MDWKNRTKTIIKSELAKKDIDYKELALKLKEVGVEDDNVNLSNKINRGTFSFILALQIFEVLDIEILRLKD
ncbi:hypothetical protein CRU99_05035 [Malaciobacter mytili]|uniref:DUF6471 domain-containing protein n=1 Tax=Malaciobacter mytili TaxID=603050 RepID=UPI00100B50A5|nr:DUF6471 domain-containing protein [Malaciobacter mytili]RXI44512.1 hypothetical protein CRU99_05035 [Malaciobacter mytili]